jgi:hypothetical protein
MLRLLGSLVACDAFREKVGQLGRSRWHMHLMQVTSSAWNLGFNWLVRAIEGFKLRPAPASGKTLPKRGSG